jgi:hypothetical protein
VRQYRRKKWQEDDVAKLLEEMNEFEEDDDVVSKPNQLEGASTVNNLEAMGKIHPGPLMGKCVVKYALMAKTHFGVQAMNTANRLAVRRWIRDKMVEGGLRPSHISGHIEVSTNLTFIPTIAEMQSRVMLTTQCSVGVMDEWNTIGRGTRRWYKPWTYNNRVLSFDTI